MPELSDVKALAVTGRGKALAGTMQGSAGALTADSTLLAVRIWLFILVRTAVSTSVLGVLTNYLQHLEIRHENYLKVD